MIHSENAKAACAVLTDSSRSQLLNVARTALRNHFGERLEQPRIEPQSALAQPGMAFVTLKKGSRLRGCIGNLAGTQPLLVVVSECAVAAATRDPRFPPVQLEELAELRLSVSVVGNFRRVAAPQEIEIGRHGILLVKEQNRGILLPQVAVEMGLDAVGFMETACRKASLPTNAWKQGATIQSFTAQVFSAPLIASI